MKSYYCVFTLYLAACRAALADITLDNSVNRLHDPDVDLSTPDMIRRHGYPAEAHTIQTSDGYLLTLHRIPHGARELPRGQKPVVFLQHGLVGSSADYVLSGPGKSLAFILSDAGYDVWLGNARGNTYSRAHVSLSTHDPAFWNFSFHEMGVLDLPAAVDHVLATSSAKHLVYVGHSMGTTMFYAFSTTLPEYSSKIAAMFSLAPVAFMMHIRSPIRLLAPWAHDIALLAKLLGANELMPQGYFIRFLARHVCEAAAIERKICENFLFAICGFDAQQFDERLLPVILAHTPAGTATKVLVHFAQLIQSGKFQQYDYGSKINKEVYNQSTPPEYVLAKIQVPVALHFSDNDFLSNKTDVSRLADQLGNKLIGLYEVPLPSFNHLDFVWGKDAKTLVYDNLIAVMKNFTLTQNTSKREKFYKRFFRKEILQI